eukprot:419385_1
MAQRISGIVQRYIIPKRFGFITYKLEEEIKTIFFHKNDINATGQTALKTSDKVEFEIDKNEKGQDKAINISGPKGAEIVRKILKNDNKKKVNIRIVNYPSNHRNRSKMSRFLASKNRKNKKPKKKIKKA